MQPIRVSAVIGLVALPLAALGQPTLIRVAQTREAGPQALDPNFDAGVMGVIAAWPTDGSSRDFYQYDSPIADSFNGIVPLVDDLVHLFFVDAADGLTFFAVFDKPGNLDGGRVQMGRTTWPRAAMLEDMPGIDRESNWCSANGWVTGGGNGRNWRYGTQSWSSCCTDGWGVRLDRATWTAVRLSFTEASSNCGDELLYSGLNSIAAISADGSHTPLRLGQERIQFRPVEPCELVAWPSSQAVCAGASSTLYAQPDTTGSSTFVWMKGDQPVELSSRIVASTVAGRSALTISNAGPADAGDYSCAVVGPCGTQMSDILTLSVSTTSPLAGNVLASGEYNCGSDATLAVSPGGSGPFRFQWVKNGALMHDVDGKISGSDSEMLVIYSVDAADSASYECIVSNACESDTTSEHVISVGLCCPMCAADFDQDGGISGGDIAAFFSDFEAGGACSDVDLDGGVTGSDIAAFFLVYEAGGC